MGYTFQTPNFVAEKQSRSACDRWFCDKKLIYRCAHQSLEELEQVGEHK